MTRDLERSDIVSRQLEFMKGVFRNDTVQDPAVGYSRQGVIFPFLTGCVRRIHAAIFSFCAGVMPPMPMFGRSLL